MFRISRSVSFCCLCLFVTLNSSLPAQTPAPAISGKLGTPIQLFDGKSLDGWFWFPRPPRKSTTAPAAAASATTKPSVMSDVWSVRDGMLHDAGKPIGYLRTEKSYPDGYVLTVEQRHAKKGNGGILIAIGAEDKIWPGLEIQGASGDIADFWNQSKIQMKTDPARQKDRRTIKIGPSSEHPVGEWNTVVVTVDHGHLWVTVNGQLQNEATEVQDMTGRIGLQAEGAEMEFRKVELTPIEKP